MIDKIALRHHGLALSELWPALRWAVFGLQSRSFAR
jgi:hypothetical protein